MSIDKETLAKLNATRPQAIGRLLLLARRDFTTRVANQMKAKGLDEIPPALLSLSAYIDLDGVRSTELAERAGMTKQAVGKIVKQLEAQGLVVRENDSSDGRAFLVKLTELSLQHLVALYAVVDHVEQEYEQLLGKPGMSEFRTALHAIVGGGKEAGALAATASAIKK